MRCRGVVGTLFGLILLAVHIAAAWTAGPAAGAEDEPPRGLVRNEPGVAPGYTLISPSSSLFSYLLDAEGRVVHQWESRYRPGHSLYLLPNGNLQRGIQAGLPTRFRGGGISGGLQEFTWDGQLLWEFHLATDRFHHHHDIEPLPNGNVLMIAWEARSQQEALEAGRLPAYAGEGGIWPEAIFEIEPLRPHGARVVWEWHVWDHLVQDTDPKLPNYGLPQDHPGRIDINADIPRAEREQAAGQEQGNVQRRRERTDWLHFNGVDYNAELDQIVVSSHAMSEIWIIDHSTTTEEAAGTTGGKAGQGGDLLYRWGNPERYNMGTEGDRRLFNQHNPEWVPEGYPGAGNITIFNNGPGRPGGQYSTVVEITPPLQPDRTYAREADRPFQPAEPAWEYNPPEAERFFATNISGAQRLQNGNTLICSGPQGRIFEVSPDGKILWEYLNPYAPVAGNNRPTGRSYGMFRATRIAADHPALRGKSLTPLDPQPKTALELFAEQPRPVESSPGWRSLMNDQAGWVSVNSDQGATFRVQRDPDNSDSTILLSTGKPAGMLRSDRMYENLILELEWRIVDAEANAGLLLWADPLPAVGGPMGRGIEVEICDRGNGDTFTSHGDLLPIWGSEMIPDPRFRSSGTRSMPRAEDFHVRPRGEWNHYRVTAIDGSVELEVNGHLVTAGSQCTPSKGYLGLVAEGGEVRFRNARIWELPPGSHAADRQRTAASATSHRPLYNGVDLGTWSVLAGDWKAEDWRLTCASSPGEIEIDLPENARHVFFDFRRADTSGRAARLPLRMAGARFTAAGEDGGSWNRVHVYVTDTEVAVECGGMRQTTARGAGAPRLALVNDGVAIEFCNIFVQSLDRSPASGD